MRFQLILKSSFHFVFFSGRKSTSPRHRDSFAQSHGTHNGPKVRVHQSAPYTEWWRFKIFFFLLLFYSCIFVVIIGGRMESRRRRSLLKSNRESLILKKSFNKRNIIQPPSVPTMQDVVCGNVNFICPTLVVSSPLLLFFYFVHPSWMLFCCLHMKNMYTHKSRVVAEISLKYEEKKINNNANGLIAIISLYSRRFVQFS